MKQCISTSTGKTFDVSKPVYSGSIVEKLPNGQFKQMTLFLTGKTKSSKNEATFLQVEFAGGKTFVSESVLHQ